MIDLGRIISCSALLTLSAWMAYVQTPKRVGPARDAIADLAALEHQRFLRLSEYARNYAKHQKTGETLSVVGFLGLHDLGRA